MVHLASYLLWPLALVHGIGSASVDGTLVLVVSLGCAALGGAAVAWRVASTAAARPRALVAAEAWR